VSPRRGKVVVDVTIAPCSDCPSTNRIVTLIERVMDGESSAWSLIGVILTDHERVLDLNRQWLRHDHHTDVLSFLIEERDDGLEGEIYVDVETARERCGEFDASPTEEIERYIVHGLLHLTGHDDADAAGRARMRALEDVYLRS